MPFKGFPSRNSLMHPPPSASIRAFPTHPHPPVSPPWHSPTKGHQSPPQAQGLLLSLIFNKALPHMRPETWVPPYIHFGW